MWIEKRYIENSDISWAEPLWETEQWNVLKERYRLKQELEFQQPLKITKNLSQFLETTSLKPELIQQVSVSKLADIVMETFDENPKMKNAMSRKVVFAFPWLEQKETSGLAELSLLSILNWRYGYWVDDILLKVIADKIKAYNIEGDISSE